MRTLKKMKRKRASTTIYVIFFFVMFLAFSAFAVDATIVFTQRAKLQNITEQTALAAASYFNYDNTVTAADKKARVLTEAGNIFTVLSQDSLKYATANIQANGLDKTILVESSVLAQPLFLSFLGVSGVNVRANACAQSSPKGIQIDTVANGDITWLTPSAVYFSNIMSDPASTQDTSIAVPLGDFDSASFPSESLTPAFDLINTKTDDHGLNFGPGGYVTIRLPAPIIDKLGNDLYIKEAGAAKEGYMVFAGLDVDPADSTDSNAATGPYIKPDKPGAGIKWVNISCAGTSDDGIGSAVDTSATYTKIYGSAYFDLGASCDGHSKLSMVKYLRIIDDNEETAYMRNERSSDNPKNYVKVNPLGESSTSTAGVDISEVRVENFVALIPPSTYVAEP